MAARRTTGARDKLGEELDAKLADFCEANLGVKAKEITRRALHAYIDGFLDTDPKMRARYDEARRKRLNIDGPKVVPFQPK